MPHLSPLSLNPPNLPAPPLPHLDFHRPTTTSTTGAPSTTSDLNFDFAFDNNNPYPDTEPETTHLLPPPTPKRHTVRVQGQLVLVKSVSVNNLSPAPGPSSPGLGVGVGMGAGERPVSGMPPASRVVETALGGGGVGGRRRMSFTAFGQQDGQGEGLGMGGIMVDETEEERRARKGRDRQLRGYGIGGRGNIRESFFLSLLGVGCVLTLGGVGRPTEVAPFGGKKGGGLASAPTTPMEGTFPKKGWNLREKLGLGVPPPRRD